VAQHLRTHHATPGHQWVSLSRAAHLLGIPVETLREWITLGRIQSRQTSNPDEDLLVLLSQSGPDDDQASAAVTTTHLTAVDPGIVGRNRELNTLSQALDLATHGSGCLVLLAGEAGVGKTTLVNALISIAEARGFDILIGHSFDVEHTPPYGPWIEIFRRLPPRADPSTLPSIMHAPDGWTDANSPSELYSSVEEFLIDSSRSQPLIVALKDQHWADQASLDLLRYLARRLQDKPILFLLTYRDVELSADQPLYRFLPHLIREANARRLTLRRLDRDAVSDIVRLRYALTDSDEDRLTEYLWRYAEGNPFFTEELANHLEDEGVLRQTGACWELGTLPEFRIPPIVRQVIENRLLHLSRASRDTLQFAAAIGVEAPIELWQAAAGVSADDLAECINQALKGQLIEELPERSSIRFRHALIQEALYDGLTIFSRRAVHQRIAEILAVIPQSDPEVVAHHFTQARDHRAVDWLLQTGRRATLRFAYHEAIARFEQARALLEHRSNARSELAWLLCEMAIAYRYLDPRRGLQYVETAWEHSQDLDDRSLQAILLRTRSHLRGFLGEDGLPELYDAVAAYDALSDAERARINQTVLAYTVSKGTVAQRVAYYARYEDARSIGERFLKEADPPISSNQHSEHGIAHLGLGLAYANLGQPDAARGAFASARDHLQRTANHFLFAQTFSHEYRHVIEVYYPERVETRRQLIEEADRSYQKSIFAVMSNHHAYERIYTALLLDGRWDDVRESAQALVTTQYMRTECAEVLSELEWCQGNYEQVWYWINQAIPAGSSAEPASVYYHEILSMQFTAAQVALATGQPEIARDWIEANERWQYWGDTVVGKYGPDFLWARYHQSLGEFAPALEHARRAVTLCLNPRQPLRLLRSERLLGTIAGEMGLIEEAERHLGVAVDLTRSVQAPYETALTEIEYANLLISTHKTSAAQSLLQQAHSTLEALGARPALDRLATVESRLATSGRPDELVAGLSPREVEVLQLVAQGLTDAEIGERLFISRRTVSGHLQSIFNKCAVSSRAAATAFAYKHGIVGLGE
jgi:DNA-binding CsgD family transcriptional regulator/tetratricopeptide (TPR) repeat protein